MKYSSSHATHHMFVSSAQRYKKLMNLSFRPLGGMTLMKVTPIIDRCLLKLFITAGKGNLGFYHQETSPLK